MFLLGGFSNLSGDVEVWNVLDFAKIGQFSAHCTVSCEWSINGCNIICGVLFPKLRMDNNYKIFNYLGEMIKVHEFNKDLYEVVLKPYPFPE